MRPFIAGIDMSNERFLTITGSIIVVLLLVLFTERLQLCQKVGFSSPDCIVSKGRGRFIHLNN